MPKEEKKLTPEEEREARLRAEKAKIEAEIKRKIGIERRREKIFGFIKKLTKRKNLIKIGIGIVVLLVVIIGGCNIMKLAKAPKPTPIPRPAPPVEVPIEVERPPEGFEIQTEKVYMIKINKNEYDVMVRIKNTNPSWGVSRLGYTFKLLDAQENVVAQKSGITFILPLSRRSICEVGIITEKETQKAVLELDLEEVQKLKTIPDLGISTKDVKYNLVEDKTKGKVWGILVNKGPYSFERVYLNIILYDKAGEICGLNYTYIGNFLSGQERYFSAYWTKPPKVWVDRVEAEPNIDLFKSTAFIKEYRVGEPLEY